MGKAEEIAIKVTHVNKSFKLPHEKQGSIKGLFVNMFSRKRTYEKQKVLQDISFEIKKGEFFGIVGRNGSGKSTLLKLLAGIYSPDSGHIEVNGKLTPFIELGVGFNPELTGRENVFLNGALLGFSRKEMFAMYDEIVEFAELEKFMDQKLKNYSSGMQVRLAFSIAIRAKSDILLIDEVLAVGDINFQRKCFNYFKELKDNNKTVIFVSHDTEALLKFCTQGQLIEQGRVIKKDRIDRVVNSYLEILNEKEAGVDSMKNNNSNRWGSGEITVKKIEISVGEKKTDHFNSEHKDIMISVTYAAHQTIENPIYGIIISDEKNDRVFASNTLINKVKTSQTKSKSQVIVKWEIPNVFNSGTFSVAPAVANMDGSVIYDWIEDAKRFSVLKEINTHTAINVNHKILIS